MIVRRIGLLLREGVIEGFRKGCCEDWGFFCCWVNVVFKWDCICLIEF